MVARMLETNKEKRRKLMQNEKLKGKIEKVEEKREKIGNKQINKT